MKHILSLIFCALLLSLSSCGDAPPNSQVDEGEIENNTYSNQEIGWTIKIPKGWSVVAKDKVEEFEQKGSKAMGEVADIEGTSKGLRHLISFQKNSHNIFMSTSEPFKIEYEGEWEKSNEALKNLMLSAFKQQGIRVVASQTKTEKIDELDFITYNFTIYGPKGNVILKQDIYSRYINGFDVGVNINYNNESYKNKMMQAWKQSKFKIR